MNAIDALMLLDRVCSQVSLTRADHQRIAEAVQSIRKALSDLEDYEHGAKVENSKDD